MQGALSSDMWIRTTSERYEFLIPFIPGMWTGKEGKWHASQTGSYIIDTLVSPMSLTADVLDTVSCCSDSEADSDLFGSGSEDEFEDPVLDYICQSLTRYNCKCEL